ncbi:MAG: hypothetical protein M1830_008678 [Pleopsidium flavum]|nr:MAG: hypothetical protein M1830_008678 [Pleopsidium flavum]
MYRPKSVQSGPSTPPSLPLNDLSWPVSSDSAKADNTTYLLTTTVLVNNIHCASCVAYVKEVLRDLSSPVWNVNVSTLTHEVRTQHDTSLSAAVICRSLNDAAFEIYDAITTDPTGSKISEIGFGEGKDGWLEQAAGYWRRSYLASSSSSNPEPELGEKRKRHIENCEACQREEADALEKGLRLRPGTSKGKKPTGLPLRPSKDRKDETTSIGIIPREQSWSHETLPALSQEKILSTPPETSRHTEAGLGKESMNQSFVVIHKPGEDVSDLSLREAAEEWSVVLSTGGMTCASCTGAITHGLEDLDFVTSVNVTLLTNSATVTFIGSKANADLIVEKIEDLGYDASVEQCYLNRRPEARTAPKEGQHKAQRLKATLSIGGMTCASCTGSVTRGLEELQYVENVAIDLLSNSGTVIFTGREHLDAIVEKVEDLGYDCTVQECIFAQKDPDEDEDAHAEQGRTVMLSIEGMFCEHCPPRITDAVNKSFPDQIMVEKRPTLKDPIMEVTYTPQLPYLTVRHIIATIRDTNDAFKVTIYHPPTIEQRSRAMQLHERRRLLLRLLLSFIVAIPTFLIGVVWMSLVPSTNSVRAFFDRHVWAGNVTRSDWGLFILATPVFFFAADVFHIRALKEIRALWRRSSRVPVLRRFYRFGSMNLLISAGTSVAYFASLAVIILDATTMTRMSGSSATYFDSVVFLTFFILIGRFLEAYSKAKTGDAVAMLGQLRPSQALLVNPSSVSRDASQDSQETIEQPSANTGPEKVDVDLLEAGDTVLIPHGVSPPADGMVVVGSSQFDESSLTGESRPITKIVGDKVFAGSINTGKPITVKITGINGTSMLDQIVSVVREGHTRRAPVERVADILTGYFVPVITLLAILTFIVWLSLGQSGVLPTGYLDANQGGWIFWSLEFAIAVFVVACPCGIGLAAPTAMFVGSGLAAKHGILVRGGGEAFQEASNLDVIVFDKTGTLTEGGSLKVTDHDMLASEEKEKIAWTLAKSLEESSGHPIAKAIVEFCETKDHYPIQNADIEEVPGYGLRGQVILKSTRQGEGFEAAIGNETFMTSLGVDIKSYFSSANMSRWKTEGKSVALLAMRDLHNPEAPFALAAQFGTTDPVRPEAQHIVRKIQEAGMSVYMLSGDNATTASSVGQAVGIPASNVIAGVLPAEKAEKIQWLQNNAPKRRSTNKASKHDGSRRANVAFVGDGINDAPALTAATVSIAIGSGSDIALSSSSFILLTSNLVSLLTLLDLSRTVFRRIKFNFAWALVYNVCLVPVAAGVIYPASGHPRLGPVWASAAMAASSVSVVLSSLALRSRVPGLGFRAAK